MIVFEEKSVVKTGGMQEKGRGEDGSVVRATLNRPVRTCETQRPELALSSGLGHCKS